ncbi:MAG: CDP-diacylglycerol--serine O-phosphatidyltransferase [Anaerolineae bacterium]|nr:CDP-diacylglycerol--serine O-phosphatidyltransferase [Anaerolineae bacterium]
MPRRVSLVLPSIVTFCSLMLGVLAIMVLADGNFLLAALMITLGSVLDVLDGQLASRLDAVSDIGKELDSLADVVTFGVAPTMFFYHMLIAVGVDQRMSALVSLAFVVAGAFRLARFNTIPSDRNAFFKGMPIPMASVLLITASFWQHWVINIWWVIIVFTISFLMVSPFAYPKSNHVINMPRLAWGGIGGYSIFFWLIAGWQGVPLGLFLLYACSGPFISFLRPPRR